MHTPEWHRGRVVSWTADYGWILPDDAPFSKQVWVHAAECPLGRSLRVGQRVRYQLDSRAGAPTARRVEPEAQSRPSAYLN